MKHRVIYNDDFRTIMSFDQAAYGEPSSVGEWRDLIERVRGTGITSYVMDSIEFDNKVYFATKRGIDWANIDFDSFVGTGADGDTKWKGGDYSLAAQVMKEMRGDGHEPLQVFVDSCRDMGMEAIAGVRMNDCHGLQPLSTESPDVSLFLKEHPELALRYPGTDVPSRLADYGRQEVRDYRFGVIRELLETFDYDGIELNWLRFPLLFQPDYIQGSYAYITPDRFAELAPIITNWMCDIRAFMDELAAKNGKPRMCFGVRVPETPEIARNIGIDLPAWIHEAGLDYIVPSAFHATNFNIPVQQFKAICEGSECAVYPCMFPNVVHWPKTTRTYQTEVYAAAAQTYYGTGADGVEVFNHFHPACKTVGLPFNTEALNVIAAPESAARHPLHHYYIPFSAEPADEPAQGFTSGYRGTRIPVAPLAQRRKFEFYFGDNLTDSGRKLDLLRFKIFDMSPDDAMPSVFLNDVRLTLQLSWRQRYLYQHTHMPKSGMPQPIVWKKIGWQTAERYEDLQPLAGEEIPADERQEALKIIDTPTYQRPEMRAAASGEGGDRGYGKDVFILVDAEVSSIPPTALRTGLNRLWVQVDRRRDDARTDLYMGEVEIVTVRLGAQT